MNTLAERIGLEERSVAMMIATDSVNTSLRKLDDKTQRSSRRVRPWLRVMVNCIDRLGLVKAELKCVFASRCKATVLAESATPRGSNRSLGRGERGIFAIQGQLRGLAAQVMTNYMTDVGAEHRLMCFDGAPLFTDPPTISKTE